LSTPSAAAAKIKLNYQSNGVVLPDVTRLIDNPMVKIDEVSDDSNSDRMLGYMKSFSRSTSPAVLSASSSQVSLSQEDSRFRSRLNSAKEDYHVPVRVNQINQNAANPRSEKVQYASLMKELQKAIVNKKDTDMNTSKTNSKASSRQDSEAKSSDTEFSRELEAALQMIQDLESPNVDTPSENKLRNPNSNRRASRSPSEDSDKTLSAVGSIAEVAITSPEKLLCRHGYQTCHYCQFNTSDTPDQEKIRAAMIGKIRENPVVVRNGNGNRVVIHCDSQSTSGYSSPTHSNRHSPEVWSHSNGVSTNTSSTNRSDYKCRSNCQTDIYPIRNAKSTSVVNLCTKDDKSQKMKSVTLVNICGDNEFIDAYREPVKMSFTQNDANNQNVNLTSGTPVRKSMSMTTSTASVTPLTTLGNVKSLLRKKRMWRDETPKFSPNLEAAILKSESLAYLSENELVERYEENLKIRRQIEQRVQQQLGIPWIEEDSI